MPKAKRPRRFRRTRRVAEAVGTLTCVWALSIVLLAHALTRGPTRDEQ